VSYPESFDSFLIPGFREPGCGDLRDGQSEAIVMGMVLLVFCVGFDDAEANKVNYCYRSAIFDNLERFGGGSCRHLAPETAVDFSTLTTSAIEKASRYRNRKYEMILFRGLFRPVIVLVIAVSAFATLMRPKREWQKPPRGL
jgi:hypothetical protein